MIKTMGDFLEKNRGSSIRRIIFSLFGEDVFNTFKSEIEMGRISEKNTA